MSVRQTILDNLETLIVSIADDASYPIEIRTVRRIDQAFLTETELAFPLVAIADPGPVTVLVQDSTHERIRMRLYLIGVVQATAADELSQEQCKMVSWLQQFVNAYEARNTAALGDNHLQTKMVQIRSNEPTADGEYRSQITCEIDVRYYVTRGAY